MQQNNNESGLGILTSVYLPSRGKGRRQDLLSYDWVSELTCPSLLQKMYMGSTHHDIIANVAKCELNDGWMCNEEIGEGSQL